MDERGEALNDALGNLQPFADDAEDVLAILDRQEAATQGLVRDTGAVFEALTEREGQLRELVVNSNRVFETTASRDEALADTFTAFPTFLRETRETVRRTTEFARDTNPLVTQLRPAARELSPTLIDLSRLAPGPPRLLPRPGPADQGLSQGPAGARVGARRDQAAARADRSVPGAGEPDPRLPRPLPAGDRLLLRPRRRGDAGHRPPGRPDAGRCTTCAPPTRSTSRTSPPIRRALPTNRSNPYVEPGGYSQLPQGLPVFGEYLCNTEGPLPTLGAGVVDPLLSLLNEFVFDVVNAGGVDAALPRAGPAGAPGGAGWQVSAAAAESLRLP